MRLGEAQGDAALSSVDTSGGAAATSAGFAGGVGIVSPDSPLGVFLSIAPMVACIGCFLMPGLTAWHIHKRRDTRDVPVLPFLSMATQCVVWLCYGMMVDNATIYVPNATGLVLGTLYTCVFNQHAPAALRPALRLQYLFSAGIILFVLAVVAMADAGVARTVVALIAAGGSVLFAFSPLAALVTVMKTRSTESMPIKTSLILFFNGGLWVLFGTLVKPDPAVYVPNILGTFAGILQLAVHAFFAVSRVPGGASAAKYARVPMGDVS